MMSSLEFYDVIRANIDIPLPAGAGGVRTLTLKLEPDQPVVMTVEYLVSPNSVATALKDFVLTPRK